MKVVILENFEGWPDPTKGGEAGVNYKAAPDPIEVPDAFGELIVKKGHARKAAADVARPRAAKAGED